MEKKDKIVVGQKVYLKPTFRNSRSDKEIQEYEVKKVGRKYLEVWQDKREYTVIKFDLKTLKEVSRYSPDWEIYFDKQVILDEEEHLKLAKEIRQHMGDHGFTNLTLEQLRKIKEIIDNK